MDKAIGQRELLFTLVPRKKPFRKWWWAPNKWESWLSLGRINLCLDWEHLCQITSYSIHLLAVTQQYRFIVTFQRRSKKTYEQLLWFISPLLVKRGAQGCERCRERQPLVWNRCIHEAVESIPKDKLTNELLLFGPWLWGFGVFFFGWKWSNSATGDERKIWASKSPLGSSCSVHQSLTPVSGG